jgi:hypothetical protein
MEMPRLLGGAGFTVVDWADSSPESLAWFKAKAARLAEPAPQPVTFATFLGADYPQMARNQVANLSEQSIQTVTFICEA